MTTNTNKNTHKLSYIYIWRGGILRMHEAETRGCTMDRWGTDVAAGSTDEETNFWPSDLGRRIDG